MIIGIFIFIIGLIFGSFLNALEYRITEEKSMGGRSFCPNCKHQLNFLDLIPVVSWLMLFGKCRYCNKKISFQYPLLEVLTAFSFILAGIQTDLIKSLNDYLVTLTIDVSYLQIIEFVLLSIIYFLFILIALHDAKTKYVLSLYTYAALIFAFVYQMVTYTGNWDIVILWEYLLPIFIAALIPASFFFALSFGSKGKWMGAGDAEIALSIGALLGITLILPAYYFAFIVGAAWSLVLIANKKAKMKSEVPLGPFLISGAFFAIIFGQQIIDWYAKIILGH